MAKIKLEHIDNLRRGKKSWIKLGSRWIPHHLYKYEEQKYNRALKSKFLEVTNKERENLENLWQKVCIVQWWRNYVLKKDTITWNAEILLSDVIIHTWTLKKMKEKIKILIT